MRMNSGQSKKNTTESSEMDRKVTTNQGTGCVFINRSPGIFLPLFWLLIYGILLCKLKCSVI